MSKSLLALPLAALAALPLWVGADVDQTPLAKPPAAPTWEVAPESPVVLAETSAPTAPVAATRFARTAPEAATTVAEEPAATALPLAHEPRRLPSGLLLDAAATEEALTAHYAGLTIDGLTRQVHRIDQVIALLDAPPVDDPLLRTRLREFAGEQDALHHERNWLHRQLNAYIGADDQGERVPTIAALDTFIERHRDKDMEDLHVLQVQVNRRYRLLNKRAIQALFDAGEYKVEVYDKDRGPIG